MDRSFYKKAADYWSKIDPTLEGVLGGFGFISAIDIQGSRQFLEELFQSVKSKPQSNLALDCGAGIGRISQGVLVSYFEKVDLVEQNQKFLEVAESTIIEDKGKIGNLYPIGLQDFKPALGTYDVIWCQWVLGHLTDNDLVKFFENCIGALKDKGIIIVKENVTSSGKVEKDDVDSSVTRPLALLLNIFKRANLKIIKQHKQTNFPAGIYPVHIFALKPKLAKVEKLKEEEEELAKTISFLTL